MSTALAWTDNEWGGHAAAEAARDADRHLADAGRVLATATNRETDTAVLDVLRRTETFVRGVGVVVLLPTDDRSFDQVYAWTPFGVPSDLPPFAAGTSEWLRGLLDSQTPDAVVLRAIDIPERAARMRAVVHDFDLAALGILPIEDPSGRAGAIVTGFRDEPDAIQRARFQAISALGPLLRAVYDRQQRDAADAEDRAVTTFRSLVHRSPDVVLSIDEQAMLSYVSPSVHDILGYEPAEIIGHNVLEFVHPDDQHDLASRFAAFPLGGAHRRPVVRVRHRDGSWRHLESVLTDLRAQPGFGAFVAMARDVTELVETEEALRRNEEHTRALMRHSTDMIAVVDRDGRILRGAFNDVLGHSPEALLNHDPFTFVDPHDVARVKSALARACTQPGDPVRFDLRARHADGSWRDLEAVVTDWSDDPAVGGIVVNAHDVTERVIAERERRESDEKVRLFAERASDMIYRYRVLPDQGFEYVSPSAFTLLGFTPEDFYADRMLIVKRMHPDDREHAMAQMQRTDPAQRRLLIRCRHRDGRWIWTEHRTVPIVDDLGRMVAAEGIARDVTRQVAAEEQIRQRELLARSVLESIQGPATVVDREGTILQVNADWAAAFEGRSQPSHLDGTIGTNYLTLCDAAAAHGQPAAAQAAAGVRAVLSGAQESFRLDYPSYDIGNEERWFVMRVSPLRTAGGGAVVHHVDITDRKQYERELASQALHDHLTGLPNRALVTDRLEGAVARGRWRRPSIAVLVLDLDRFAVVNDGLGREAGDQLLVAAAVRLRKLVRPEDTVARLAGDEFVVLCEGPAVEREAEALAERIVRAFRASLRTRDGVAAIVTVSVGVALGNRKTSGDALLRNANAAVHRAKQLGRDRFARFDERRDVDAFTRFSVEAELHVALERQECRLVYQPIVDLALGRIEGIEALLRWEHPTRGLLAPEEFLEVAEDAGLLVPIGGWVLHEACAQLARWEQAHARAADLSISVNVAAQQVRRKDFSDEVRAAITEARIAPERVVLELTENSLLDADLSPVIEQLHDIGVRIAIDDFGTGYSSMSYLKRFAVDEVKIDRTFVAGLGRDPDDEVILSAVVEMSRNLGLDTVAEGVESPGQRDALLALGCRRGQGYLFGKPCDPEEIDAILDALDDQL